MHIEGSPACTDIILQLNKMNFIDKFIFSEAPKLI